MLHNIYKADTTRSTNTEVETNVDATLYMTILRTGSMACTPGSLGWPYSIHQVPQDYHSSPASCIPAGQKVVVVTSPTPMVFLWLS